MGTLGLSQHAVRKGLAALIERGLVEKRPRAAYYMREPGRADAGEQLVVLAPNYRAGHPAWLNLVTEAVAEAFDPARFLVSCVYYDPTRFERVARQLEPHGIRGALLVSHRDVTEAAVRQLLERGIELVGLDSHPALRKLGIAAFTQRRSIVVQDLIDGLVARGHHELRLVEYTYPKHRNSLAGYDALTRHFGARAAGEMVVHLPNKQSAIDFEPLEELFQGCNLPTAAIVPDECVALEMFRRCQRHGIRVPEDLSLAACHDLMPEAHPVPLTAGETVRSFKLSVGYAVRHLAALLAGERPAPVHVNFEREVIWRESVAERAPANAHQSCAADGSGHLPPIHPVNSAAPFESVEPVQEGVRDESTDTLH